jgi:hypothetical protein
MTLAAAAGRGHKSIGRQFLDAGANVNTVLKRDYGTALAATARNGHKCIVRQLLDVGANVNIVSRRWDGTASAGAAREGRERIVASCSMQALRQGCLKRRVRHGVGGGGERSQVYTAASCLTYVNIISEKGYGTAFRKAAVRGHKAVCYRAYVVR